MVTRFPSELGDIGGKTFEEVWAQNPKWTEFVRCTWTDKCTGIFLEFYKFVHRKCEDEQAVGEHFARCLEYVKSQTGDLPKYLLKYRQ